MYYREKLNNLNILFEVVVQLNNMFYKLVIKIQYNKANSNARLYFGYISYQNRQI